MKQLTLILLCASLGGCEDEVTPKPVCYKWHLEFRPYSHLKLMHPESDLQKVCDSPTYHLISNH